MQRLPNGEIFAKALSEHLGVADLVGQQQAPLFIHFLPKLPQSFHLRGFASHLGVAGLPDLLHQALDFGFGVLDLALGVFVNVPLNDELCHALGKLVD